MGKEVSRMNIIVLDTVISGHREMYYKTIAEAFFDLNGCCNLFAPNNSECNGNIIYTHLSTTREFSLKYRFQITKRVLLIANSIIRIFNLLTIQKKIKKITFDFVFFPCLDDILPYFSFPFMTDILMPYKWSGLLISASTPKGLFPDYRRSLNCNNCVSVGILTEDDIDIIKKYNPNVQLFPDFTSTAEPNVYYQLYNDVLKMKRDTKLVSLLGAIDSRKGVLFFLDVIDSFNEDNYSFLIAGGAAKLSNEEMRRLLKISKRSNCIVSLSRIPDESCFNALISCSDVLFAAYDNFAGSSNILTKAAYFKVPVIVSSGHCMGNRVSRYKIGATVEYGNIQNCHDKICNCCNDIIEDVCYDSYYQRNSYDELKEALERIRV